MNECCKLHIAIAYEDAAQTACLFCQQGIPQVGTDHDRGEGHICGRYVECKGATIRSRTPAHALAALAEHDRLVRLGEAKWWAAPEANLSHSLYVRDGLCRCEGCQRIAALSQPAPKGEGERK